MILAAVDTGALAVVVAAILGVTGAVYTTRTSSEKQARDEGREDRRERDQAQEDRDLARMERDLLRRQIWFYRCPTCGTPFREDP